MSTFYITPKDEDLQHYGVLGMKWGVRRYQNADGSLTSEGKKRYSNEEKFKVRKEKFKKSNDFLTAEVISDALDSRHKDFDPYKKRINDAAVLGLKAFNMPVNDSNKTWFLFEDQTIGLPLFADLVNQGKTSGQIKAIMQEAKELNKIDNKLYSKKRQSTNNFDDKLYYQEPFFDILVAYDTEDFIDKCIKIKDKED